MKNSVHNMPYITRKQTKILELLYRYRFLNRVQIQSMMGHKNRKTIAVWLSDLREKHCVGWIYSTDFAEKTKPAVYYLGLNGIRLLQATKNYPLPELRKRYREPARSAAFVRRSILLADCGLTLTKALASTGSGQLVRYSFVTSADYASPDSNCHFLSETESVHPDLCFTKHEDTPHRTTTKHYLLEAFDAALPRYRLRYRLKQYAGYLRYGDWERATGDKRPPTILLVCPTVAELIYAKRRIRTLLEDEPDRKQLHIKFATAAELRQSGVLGEIWEEA